MVPNQIGEIMSVRFYDRYTYTLACSYAQLWKFETYDATFGKILLKAWMGIIALQVYIQFPTMLVPVEAICTKMMQQLQNSPFLDEIMRNWS